MVRECAARGCWQTFTPKRQHPRRRYCSRRCAQRNRYQAARAEREDPTVTALTRAVTLALARDTPDRDRAVARAALDELAGPMRGEHRARSFSPFGCLIAAALEWRINGPSSL